VKGGYRKRTRSSNFFFNSTSQALPEINEETYERDYELNKEPSFKKANNEYLKDSILSYQLSSDANMLPSQ